VSSRRARQAPPASADRSRRSRLRQSAPPSPGPARSAARARGRSHATRRKPAAEPRRLQGAEAPEPSPLPRAKASRNAGDPGVEVGASPLSSKTSLPCGVSRNVARTRPGFDPTGQWRRRRRRPLSRLKMPSSFDPRRSIQDLAGSPDRPFRRGRDHRRSRGPVQGRSTYLSPKARGEGA